ncbi:uncharacterized protein [Pempheris klunzingeri]|uniref:uncharacterized protein n=1 Tax=Pempheris klunzingeri TaxID=3127111 RepID=UPI00397EC907
MSTADQLLELMFSWMEKRERCAEQLKKLAGELESLRMKCKFGEMYGSSVSVLGAACLIGAGAATFFTGGAAAPFLGLLGATYTGFGVTVSVVTKITEHFLSSDTMKKAQDIEKENNEIGERLQQLFEQLKAERGISSPDELDQYVLTEILGAMARRSGLTWKFNIRMLDDEPRFYFDTGLGHRRFDQNFNLTAVSGLAGILTFFTFELSGKEFKFLFAQGSKQLIKGLSATAFKTALKGGAMVVGGAVGMAFALPEAIDSWKELIKNNNVTEASQSLRDTAEDILKIIRTLKQQLEDLKRMFDEEAKRQQEEYQENTQVEEESGFKEEVWPQVENVTGLDEVCPQVENLTGFKDEERPQQEEQKTGNQGIETPGSQRDVGEQGHHQGEQNRQGNEETGGEQQGGGDDGDKNSGGKDEESEEEESDSEKESEDDEDEQTGRKKKKKRRRRKKTKSDQRGESDTNQGSPAEMAVGLLNVRSINNKPSRISELITRTNRSVFLTTETWAREDTADSVLRQASPENFGFNQWVRPGRGGGVAIQFERELGRDRVHFSSVTSFEYVATVLQHPDWNQPILSINLYLRPGYNQERFRTFLNEFQQLLDEASERYNSILVTGDFNIRVNPERRSYTDEFYFLLQVNNLDQHVEEPTHQRGNMLDLVITRNVHISHLTIQDDGISDHYTINFNARPASTDTGKNTKEEEDEDEQVKRLKKREE